MFGFIHDIEWMRAYTRKNQRKIRRANIKKNYKKVYREIKCRAKLGFNQTTIRFSVYDENVRRLVNEGYIVEKHNYASGPALNIKW